LNIHVPLREQTIGQGSVQQRRDHPVVPEAFKGRVAEEGGADHHRAIRMPAQFL
jgi:hypothetical protein